MTIYLKAVVKCDADGCEDYAEGDRKVKDLGLAPAVVKGTPFEGWRDVGDGKHLCPRCYPAYEAMESEHRRKRDAMLGIKRAAIEI